MLIAIESGPTGGDEMRSAKCGVFLRLFAAAQLFVAFPAQAWAASDRISNPFFKSESISNIVQSGSIAVFLAIILSVLAIWFVRRPQSVAEVGGLAFILVASFITIGFSYWLTRYSGADLISESALEQSLQRQGDQFSERPASERADISPGSLPWNLVLRSRISLRDSMYLWCEAKCADKPPARVVGLLTLKQSLEKSGELNAGDQLDADVEHFRNATQFAEWPGSTDRPTNSDTAWSLKNASRLICTAGKRAGRPC